MRARGPARNPSFGRGAARHHRVVASDRRLPQVEPKPNPVFGVAERHPRQGPPQAGQGPRSLRPDHCSLETRRGRRVSSRSRRCVMSKMNSAKYYRGSRSRARITVSNRSALLKAMTSGLPRFNRRDIPVPSMPLDARGPRRKESKGRQDRLACSPIVQRHHCRSQRHE